MKLSDFDYTLPDELIAYYPLEKRTESRLMVVTDHQIKHRTFKDIIEYCQPNDILVLNNTKVIPARLLGTKATGGQVEVLIERILDDYHVLAHVRASKAPTPGQLIHCEGHITFEMQNRDHDLFHLKLCRAEPILTLLEAYGRIPLPPYIARDVEDSDRERYQTVYAKTQGSVAAPTAGLHFDDALLAQLAAQGVVIVYLTLHVGAGTFSPVRTEQITDHRIHSEYVHITPEVCEQVNAAKAKGGRVIAVGTTTTRALESASQDGCLKPFAGETNLFIYPGFAFQCVDRMITNFHLPRSSLLILVAAFAGYETMMRAYAVAVQEHYRFYSYGDAMLIERKII